MDDVVSNVFMDIKNYDDVMTMPAKKDRPENQEIEMPRSNVIRFVNLYPVFDDGFIDIGSYFSNGRGHWLLSKKAIPANLQKRIDNHPDDDKRIPRTLKSWIPDQSIFQESVSPFPGWIDNLF